MQLVWESFFNACGLLASVDFSFFLCHAIMVLCSMNEEEQKCVKWSKRIVWAA